MLYPAELRARGGPYISRRNAGTRGRHRRRPLALLLLLLLPALAVPAAAQPLFRWSPPLAVETIAAGPVLRLADGRRLLLAGIRLPQATRQRARDAVARALAGGGIRIAEDRLARDRYGRLLAPIADASGAWLQAALLRRGLAVADPLTAPPGTADALFAAEAEARRAGRGVWAGALPLAADRVRATPLRFAVVEGRPRRAGRGRTFLYLNFGDDRRRDFTLRIRLGRLRALLREGLDPEALVGRRIRVRGWIFPAGGPMIEITDRRQIEVRE